MVRGYRMATGGMSVATEVDLAGRVMRYAAISCWSLWGSMEVSVSTSAMVERIPCHFSRQRHAHRQEGASKEGPTRTQRHRPRTPRGCPRRRRQCAGCSRAWLLRSGYLERSANARRGARIRWGSGPLAHCLDMSVVVAQEALAAAKELKERASWRLRGEFGPE